MPKGDATRKMRFGMEQHKAASKTLTGVEGSLDSLFKESVRYYTTTSPIRHTIDSARRRVAKARSALELDFRDRYAEVASPYTLPPSQPAPPPEPPPAAVSVPEVAASGAQAA